MNGLGLREDLFVDGKLLPAIAETLHGDLPCVIRDAFRPELAAAVHDCLDAHEGWESLQVFQPPFTSYNNLGIFDRARFPEPLLRFAERFDGAETRRLIAQASGADLGGPTELHASLFAPGSYQLPHNDFGGTNRVSFTWHLTRSWDAAWGGHFFWCSPPINVVPDYNLLVLFRVTPASYHFACPVAPHAAGKRLAVTDWWKSTLPAGETAAPPAKWFRGPLRDLGRGVFAP